MMFSLLKSPGCEEFHMGNRKVTARYLSMIAAWLMLLIIVAGCTSPLLSKLAPASSSISSTLVPRQPANTRVIFPATWTATNPPKNSLSLVTRTPVPTKNFPQTLVAQTTVAAGLHCQRNADAWQVFSGPIAAYAGWCQVVGIYGTTYEYKVLSPDGWVVNTYGEFTPNLVFSTGYKNVQVKIQQAFAYSHRNYSGSLEDAPEKAKICDENDTCYGFIAPNEILNRQEVKTFPDREVLVLDSTLGQLKIRRYYMILPFRIERFLSNRLFIVELTALENAMNDEEYAATLDQLGMMIQSIRQR
jgi:hypothetical protein